VQMTPITTDELLGPDKGKLQVSKNSTKHTEACLQSVIIISKFWGDEVDNEDGSDGTITPDTDSDLGMDPNELHPVALKYLEANNETGFITKTTKKAKRNKSPRNANQTGIEKIITRSQKSNNIKSTQ
jgi:hypothetical protein